MTRLLILLVGVSFFNCSEVKKPTDSIEIKDTVEQSNLIIVKNDKVSKLKRLKVWKDATRILELPFRANFDTTTEGTFRVKFWETDSIFINDFKNAIGDIYIMGLLSDTTNFYGFIFICISAVGNPGLVTFDKFGNKVDLELLTKESCVNYSDDVLFCKEYSTIGKDWSLDYYFKSIITKQGNPIDTACSQSISKGQINKNGEIGLEQIINIDCKN